MKQLTTIEEADAWMNHGEPVWVYKHSSTCPISDMVKEIVEDYFLDHGDQPVRMVIVQTARDVSNHIAAKTGVKHESPQMLLIRAGEAVWHISHGRITAHAMTEAWRPHAG
ncbi:MAG: bacillithiol system redox-active protein YtxJ [Phycisphaera sp.]|nr:bacillithiol system redox-active protein YtxJ [Phycisphaera sp.]